MALIKCPECSHKISEYSTHCIFCGCPMDKIKELLNPIKKEEEKNNSNDIDHHFSSLFNYLDLEEEVLLNKICHIIELNTDLVKKEYARNFGYRRKNEKKLIILFRLSQSKETLFITFKPKELYHPSKIKICPKNLNKIELFIEKNFSSKEESSSNITNNSTSEELLNDKEDTRLFSEKRESYEQYVITGFKSKIEQKLQDVVVTDSQYMYSFRTLKLDRQLGTFCWFSNGEKNKLAFKYYEDPLKKTNIKTIYPLSKDIDKLVELATISYLKIKLQHKDVPEYVPDYNKEEDIEESLGTPLIYELIIKAIRGKTLKGPAELVKTAKEVGDVVLTEIKYKSIEEKAFNSVEEFDKYKNSYKFVANFFGCRFSLKHLSIADAKNIYLTFKAYKLIEICKVQEKIYNAKVSTDRQATLEDFKKMIEDNDYTFSLARGLTLYFRYVPTEQMVQCVKELNELEKVYK